MLHSKFAKDFEDMHKNNVVTLLNSTFKVS